jgi:cell division protein FtsI/penicillin-binding protein 2
MSTSRRIGILIACLGLMTLALVGRLFQIAVLEHDSYMAKAKEQQQVGRDIVPRRGSIYVQDLAGGAPVIVTQSVEKFALSVTPRNVTRKEEYASLLTEITGADRERLLATFEKSGWYMEPLLHNLTKEQVNEIAKKIWDLEKRYSPRLKTIAVNFDSTQGDILQYLGGVFFIREFQRAYPEGPLMGQLLGFVNDKGVGQYGFEGQYHAELTGYEGRISLERDSRGNALRQMEQVQGQDGMSYELTIDRNVQHVVEQELAAQVEASEAKGGSVIVLDPKSGNVVAMASYPSYAPADFRTVAKESLYLFDNPAISSIWEPGSIFKTLVMGAAIDQGLLTPNTTETFGATVSVNGYTINTALRKAYGRQTMTDVLVNSDNVAMVWIGNKLGNQVMGEYIRRYGFGAVTGIDLKNEVGGRVSDSERWSDVNRATITFGQGIATTPIQVASAYGAIANDGVMIQPRLVKAVIAPDGTRTEVGSPEGRQVLKPQTAKDLRVMLTQVVTRGHQRAGVPGYKVGGKTGTAQVPDPVKGGYIPDAYNHSFAGMGPSDDPRYVMLVKIDQPNIQKVGLYAETTAVPLFGKLSRFLLQYYQVPPS